MTDPWKIKRRTRYTELGIKRIKCIRCGLPAVAQWQICSDGNNYRGICGRCDVELNRTVLEFMGHPDVEAAINKYDAEGY